MSRRIPDSGSWKDTWRPKGSKSYPEGYDGSTAYAENYDKIDWSDDGKEEQTDEVVRCSHPHACRFDGGGCYRDECPFAWSRASR